MFLTDQRRKSLSIGFSDKVLIGEICGNIIRMIWAETSCCGLGMNRKGNGDGLCR